MARGMTPGSPSTPPYNSMLEPRVARWIKQGSKAYHGICLSGARHTVRENCSVESIYCTCDNGGHNFIKQVGCRSRGEM